MFLTINPFLNLLKQIFSLAKMKNLMFKISFTFERLYTFLFKMAF